MGNLNREDADTKEMRRAECDKAKVSLRIFPARLDPPPAVWWKAES